LREAIEGSLKRLRLDRIEVYQLHVPDPAISFDLSIETLRELQSEGRIHQIGLSNVTREHIERARKIAPIVSVQNRYSVVDREWEYVVDYCEQNGIAFIPWFPLGGGDVGHDLIERIANAHGMKAMQVALAWALQRSPVMLVIPGTSNLDHLEENIAAAAFRLSDQEFRGLEEVNGKATAGRVRA
jgi:aryl-alcohol dehydrogenase-like predicted oxidoreductase